jgi:hypothetical protein
MVEIIDVSATATEAGVHRLVNISARVHELLQYDGEARLWTLMTTVREVIKSARVVVDEAPGRMFFEFVVNYPNRTENHQLVIVLKNDGVLVCFPGEDVEV